MPVSSEKSLSSRYSTLRLVLDPWFCYTDAVTQPLVLEPGNTPRRRGS